MHTVPVLYYSSKRLCRLLFFLTLKLSALIRANNPVHDVFIILRMMRKGTCGTILDRPAVVLEIVCLARTICLQIKGAVAEQTVQILHALVAGIKLAFFIAEKSIRMFHSNLFLSSAAVL